MQLDYFLPSSSLTLFEAGQRFFLEEMDLEINSLTAKPVPARAFLHGYADTTPALGKVSEIYFLGQLNDQALAENAARRRKEVNLRTTYTEVQAPTAGRAYPGLALFALDLTQTPTRTEVAELTRTFNRASNFLPVLLLLRYPAPATGGGAAGVRLALAASERLEFVQPWRQGEKIGKITTLFDINPLHLHTGHARILARLKVPTGIETLRELSSYWNKALSVKILNEDFYRDLSNWYFWAVRHIQTPAYANDGGDDVRHATALIRLITRLIFTWFLKEKGLVPNELFDEKKVYNDLLKPAATDAHGSTYYKTILQNLFFATLNTEMRAPKNPKDPQSPKVENRQFVPAANARGYSDGHGEAGFLRYEKLFTTTGKTLALDWFNRVPFLNGGLFECLDPVRPKNQHNAERVLIDCFSDTNQDKINLPDDLFFGSEQVVDLSGPDYYGDTRRKREKVSGILQILKGYTFTITENTPLEEEIALDPELLGKVFENLLAAYNPETKDTARKQTGSFYTPREVVEYMVDESLLAYLLPSLPTGLVSVPTAAIPTSDKTGDFVIASEEEEIAGEDALRRLLAEPDLKNPFDEPTTQHIIDALDHLKLLDPACGSGAFPMGALQRLTYLLARLDPDNELWKQQQIDRATAPIREDLQKLGTLNDAQIRERAEEMAHQRIQEIEEIFSDAYELDYGRKLYLIENCLYGVDIQPVAVQITKLRCFIALLVEQKATAALADKPEENLGIRPLPNLETKFVAANTLLRLDEEAAANTRRDKGAQIDLLQMDDDVDSLRQQLREVRHEYFTVRGREAKLDLKARDEGLRQRLGEALKRTLPGPDAQRLAAWNPYDLRQSADLFSPTWMLGVDDGFDVVIGNPPYGLKAKGKKYLDFVAKYYAPARKVADSYFLFIVLATNLAKKGGFVSYIVPNTFCDLEQGDEFRKWFLKENRLLNLFDTQWIFESAIVDTVVFIAKTNTPSQNTDSIEFTANNGIRKTIELSSIVSASGSKIVYRHSNNDNNKLASFIISESSRLGEFINIRAGVKLYETGKGMPPQSSKTLEDKPFTKKGNKPKGWNALLRGADIDRYIVKDSGEFVNYGEWLAAPRTPQTFTGNYIIIRRTDDKIKAAYISNGAICVNSCHVLKPINKEHNLFMLAIINSRLLQWIFEIQNPQMVGKTFAEIKVIYVENLPFKEASQSQIDKIDLLVTKILSAKAANPTADTSALEQDIDKLVYKLYGLKDYEIALVEGRSGAATTTA